MSRSEFRLNKKRKHYAYLFKDIGEYRKNILLTTKPTIKWHNKEKRNIRLIRHPNPNSEKTIYVINKIYIDHKDCFEIKTLKWDFNKSDKRKIKRLKKAKIKVGQRTHIN